MTLKDLMKRVPASWRDVPIAVEGTLEVEPIVAFELVETSGGRRCLVLTEKLRNGVKECLATKESP